MVGENIVIDITDVFVTTKVIADWLHLRTIPMVQRLIPRTPFFRSSSPLPQQLDRFFYAPCTIMRYER